MKNGIKLSREQETSISLMLKGINVFVTGSAGCGKTAVINEFRRRTSKKIAYLAPSGKAASLISGQTLHSFFSLPIGVITPETLKPLTERQSKLLSAFDGILIDEVSLMRSDAFVGIDMRLRSVGDPTRPFGGKPVYLFGDFFQLPPVVSSSTEFEYLFWNLGGPFAFQTSLWTEANYETVLLSSTFRQSGDNIFAQILESIRKGEIVQDNIPIPGTNIRMDPINALNYFTKITTTKPQGSTAICPTNSEVDYINNIHQSLIPGVESTFVAGVNGIFPENEFPTNYELKLKVGSEVILLNNLRDRTGYVYTNGEKGVITYLDSYNSTIIVRLSSNGKDVKIERHRWESREYELLENSGNEDVGIRQITVGVFEQFPLKLSYGLTVHKSQGSGFEKTHLSLNNGFFAPGQLYTALSRSSKLSDLSMSRELTVHDVIVDYSVREFYRCNNLLF